MATGGKSNEKCSPQQLLRWVDGEKKLSLWLLRHALKSVCFACCKAYAIAVLVWFLLSPKEICCFKAFLSQCLWVGSYYFTVLLGIILGQFLYNEAAAGNVYTCHYVVDLWLHAACWLDAAWAVACIHALMVWRDLTPELPCRPLETSSAHAVSQMELSCSKWS